MHLRHLFKTSPLTGLQIDNSGLQVKSTSMLMQWLDTLQIPARPNIKLTNRIAKAGAQLHQAVIQNSMDQVRALLSSGVHVDIRDNFNNEPLHLAVSQNEVNEEIVKILLDYGACPHSPGEGRKFPLHLSVKAGSILKMLLKAGPNRSTADLCGNTALHDAVLCDDSESPSCFVELLNYGADVNVLNAASQTPFHLILDRAAQPE